MSTTAQPNVLFIITDQQRADHTGFMGNSVVRTPNIDAIAARGTVFANAWVSNPVCMPNRSTIMTGRMPTAHGCVFNDRSLDWGANTFVRRLRKSGYQTALLGKSHLQHGMSRNSVVTFRGEPTTADPRPAGWDRLEDFERFLEREPDAVEDFYGFEHVELAIDHGARATGHHMHWAIRNGADRGDLLVEYEADAPGKHRSEHWWQIYQPPYDEKHHSTNFVTQRTKAFIESASAKGGPWMAMCSYPDPHHPLTPPGDWFFRHKPEDMELPASRADTLADAPAHLQIFRNTHPKQQRNWVAPRGYGDDELLREAIAATYGMVAMIDDGIGQLLRCLDEQGVADNTIIVFTSDHGDMMGDHGLLLKGFMHYRGTLQVPMVVAAPGLEPGRTDALASSIDLGPTIMDLCEVEDYDGIQGVPLTPLMAGTETSVRDAVLVEDDVSVTTSKLTPIPGRTRTVVTQEYRYTRNSKGEEQLFNLQSDPDEMTDLRKVDTTARAQMMEQLADALIAADDTSRGAPARG